MPRVYRKKRTVPIPANARPVTKRGVRGVEFTLARRGTVWGEVKGNRCVVVDERWTIRYTDATGHIREVGSGTDDYDKAYALARDIGERELRIRKGLPVPTPAAKHANATMLEQLEGRDGLVGFRQYLEDKGNSSLYVSSTTDKIRRVLESAGKLDSAAVLRAIRSFTRGGEPLTGQTVNSYIRACKGFSSWLYRRKRTNEDHLRDLDLVDAERDRKRYRRALTPKELDALVKAANANPKVTLENRRTTTAPNRGLLYQLAAGTGFRAKELRSLTRDSFDLSAKPPTVTVQAAYSKRGRRDTQPISDRLAAILRPYVASLKADQPAFVCDWPRLAEMVRADAKAAGVKVTTGAGTIDFHALRHSYATWIAAKTDAKTGQSLTRHASANLFLNVYAHQTEAARAKAVKSLP